MINLDDFTPEQLQELAFTEEELAELERARSMPITFDEDCPETTPEQLLRFHRVNPVRKVPGTQQHKGSGAPSEQNGSAN